MKKAMVNDQQKQLLFTLSMMLVLSLLTACTKPREVKIPDADLRGSVFAIADLHGKDISIQTGEFDSESVTASQSALKPSQEKPLAKVNENNAPGELKATLTGLSISAQAQQNLSVKLLVTREGLDLYKVVENTKGLPRLEQNLAIRYENKTMVPLARISAIPGILRRQKNSDGENTSNLEFKEVDFDSATHVKVELRREKVKQIGMTTADQNTLETVYLADRFQNRVTDLSTLVSELELQLVVSNENAGPIVTRVVNQGSNVQLVIYKIRKLEDIDDQIVLASLRKGDNPDQVSYCPENVLSQLNLTKENCVLVAEYNVPASYVTVEPEKDASGNTTPGQIKKTRVSKPDSGLLEIQKKSLAVSNTGIDLSPFNTIRVADIKDKKFFFRRTMSDSSLNLMLAPGFSGDLDIVEFELHPQRIIVRKTVDSIKTNTGSSLDREILLSIPVRYLKRNTSLSQGGAHISASRQDAEYITLDWSKNELAVANSPVAWLRSCFTAHSGAEIKNVDNRMSENGVLNFTLSSNTSVQPGCLSQYRLNGYWWGNSQSNVTVEERVSFKLYSEKNEQQGLDLPYRAQQMLGFGAFTAGKISPDEFGNSGRVKNEINYPINHDFSNGKILTYVVGGMPESGWMRDVLIDSAREVIADWNATLKFAFKSTPLERSGDYIELKVEGVDIPVGGLGDLDRNYIWNYSKALDSGPLGLSQATPNPKNGKIEHNNVLMYAANVWQMTGYMRQSALIRKEYEDTKERIKKEAFAKYEEAKKKRQEAEKQKQSAPVPAGCGADCETLKEEDVVDTESNNSEFRRQLVAAVNGKDSTLAQRLLNVRLPDVKNFSVDRTRHNEINAALASHEMAFLHRIVKAATEQRMTRNPMELNALIASEVLSAFGSQLPEEERNLLISQSKQFAMQAELSKHLQSKNGCLLATNSVMTAQVGKGDYDWSNDDPKDIFKSQYKWTLAHEIGHSLGLTHNFMGSVDVANFEFADQQTGRSYSTVMDYAAKDQVKYRGIGPYDVHALRATHTGLLELHSAARNAVRNNTLTTRSAVTGQAVTVPVVDGRLIHLDSIKEITLGKNGSWWDLDAAKLAPAGLRSFRYCNDYEADGGGSPLCNRWDTGRSDFEIAKHYVEQYTSAYPILNHRGNRINSVGIVSYINFLISNMLPIRYFNDELFYGLINGAFQAPAVADPQQRQQLEQLYRNRLNSAAAASMIGQQMFLEIVSAPTAQKRFSDPSRFSIEEYQYPSDEKDQNGEPVMKTAAVLVETKSISNLQTPGTTNVDTRGIEFDKAFAMMMLTQREPNHPRYTPNSIKFNYSDFNGLLLGNKSVNDNDVLGSIHNILQDLEIAKVSTEHGLISLPAHVKSEVSELSRYYTILGSLAFMDRESATLDGNDAAKFHVASTRSVLNDRPQVTRLNESVNSNTSVKLYAADGAESAELLVRSTAQKQKLIENKDKIEATFLNFLKAAGQETQDEAAIKSALEKIEAQITELNKDNLLISAEEKAVGLTEKILVGDSIRNTIELYSLVQQNWQAFAAQPAAIRAALNPMKQKASREAISTPVFLRPLAAGALIKFFEAVTLVEITDADSAEQKDKKEKKNAEAKAAAQVKVAFVNALVDTGVHESNFNTVYQNLRLQNRFLDLLYPEKNR